MRGAEEPDLSTITGLQGYDSKYSNVSEFTNYLNADLSSQEYYNGLVFWRPERDELFHDSYETKIKEKIKSALLHMACVWDFCARDGYLVQYWAAKVEGHGRHHYLTTSRHPFALRRYLNKGYCWYRKQCMDLKCVVEQLGPVGRVYRSKRPESSPDLRLYSTIEFPLRDFAARCGLQGYFALPVFDSLNNDCCGVLEFLSLDSVPMGLAIPALYQGLQAAGLLSTHNSYFRVSNYNKPVLPKYQQPLDRISKMLELAIKAVPQLHTAQVWVPCKQCANMSNNLTCMERATFINFRDQKINSFQYNVPDLFHYLEACELHNLQIGQGFARALVSSNSKSYLCRNLCDFSISKNPLAHYAQKARLSLYFALCLESVHDCNDLYVIEFFLQSNCREDARGGSFLHLLSRIMEMELKSFKFASEGQIREELLVELSQPNAIGYESSECAQERTVMERYNEEYSESEFTNCLQTDDFCCVRPSNECFSRSGWAFCGPAREGLSQDNCSSNSALVSSLVKEKIKRFMIDVASKKLFGYSSGLVQFWAPKMEKDRCYLATSDQPFALACLTKGLALFRKQCMKHHYFVDERVKEEEFGPPARVFRNGHLEITPDIRLYSTKEFPLRNDAAHCCLGGYFALPVFDIYHKKCVGVIEYVGFRSIILYGIGKALKAADLSSAHIYFEPSFTASHQVLPSVAEHRNLALAEVKDALQLVAEMPQLYIAEVWVPYGKCASINNNLSCMEMAFSTLSGFGSLPPTNRIRHVQTRKGIAGMMLASENKSCFCRNSCHFSIVEQPQAHYHQLKRLDVCFAICLQSSHTGDLYFLEFFLNQGPSNYEYFWSSLSFILSILKQELKSFKVASGQRLGEELVVEVIEFSEASNLTFSELNQGDMFPLKFKIVQYGEMEHQHNKSQKVQFVSDGVDSVSYVAQAARDINAAANSKKEDTAKNTDRGKRKIGLNLNLKDLKPYFGKRLEDVAKELHVGRSTIKRICRSSGISRWPCNEKYKNNPSLFETKSADQIVQDSQPNMGPSSSGNHLLLDTPLNQNVPQTNTEGTQHSTVQPEAGGLIVKVKFGDDIIKFHSCLSSGMNKIVDEVATRLNLKMGSFKLKYLDEDNDEILLTSDVDLQLCQKSLTAVGKTFLQLFVQLIHK